MEQLTRQTVFQMFLLQCLRQDCVHNIMSMKLLMIMPVGRLSRERGSIQTMKDDRTVKPPLQQPAQEATSTSNRSGSNHCNKSPLRPGFSQWLSAFSTAVLSHSGSTSRTTCNKTKKSHKNFTFIEPSSNRCYIKFPACHWVELFGFCVVWLKLPVSLVAFESLPNTRHGGLLLALGIPEWLVYGFVYF